MQLNKINNSLFKFLFKKKKLRLEYELQQLNEELIELNEQLNSAVISLNIDAEEVFNDLYKNVYKAFNLLKLSEKKWDVTSSRLTNKIIERTSATNTITRTVIDILETSIPLIKTDELSICFKNINGGDLFFFLGFLIFHESNKDFAIIDYTEIDIDLKIQRFIEEEKVPSDTKIIDQTWHKVNKDGTPDRRFANNYQIPIVEYGELYFKSTTGLNEVYSFSNVDSTMLFFKALYDYTIALKEAKKLLAKFN